MRNRELELLRGDCQRFQTLLESRLVDEGELLDDDAAFCADHRSRCAECGDFATMLDTLESFESDAEGVVDTGVRQLVGLLFSRKRVHRRRMVFAVAAALVAGVGALFFALVSSSEAGMGFELAHGSLSLKGETVREGDHFELEREVASPTLQHALIQIPGALYIAVAQNAELRLISATETRLSIALDKGRLAVRLVPDGPMDLTVVLPDGEVDVIGTVFVVDADSASERVEVVKGSVSVRSRGGSGPHRHLGAGRAFSLRDAVETDRTPKRADPLLQLLGVLEPQRTEAVAEATSEDEDDHDSDGADTAADEMVDTKVNGTAEPKPPLETLLVGARECRMTKDWKCAVSRYRKVVALYPSRPDAATAMVSAAQILLDKLNEPDDALAYFKKYQRRRPSGDLGREALFGECSALKALRRTEEERRCLQKYLEKYPGTLYSKMAKSRLNSIVDP